MSFPNVGIKSNVHSNYMYWKVTPDDNKALELPCNGQWTEKTLRILTMLSFEFCSGTRFKLTRLNCFWLFCWVCQFGFENRPSAGKSQTISNKIREQFIWRKYSSRPALEMVFVGFGMMYFKAAPQENGSWDPTLADWGNTGRVLFKCEDVAKTHRNQKLAISIFSVIRTKRWQSAVSLSLNQGSTKSR